MTHWQEHHKELCTTTSSTYGPYGSLVAGHYIWRIQCNRPAAKIILAQYGDYVQFSLAEFEVYGDSKLNKKVYSIIQNIRANGIII